MKGREILTELLRSQGAVHEGPHRILILLILVRPACHLLRFAHCLQHVLANSLCELFRRMFFSIRPCAYQRLIKEVFVISNRSLASFSEAFLRSIHLAPAPYFAMPLHWNFGKHVDPRTHIL